MTQLAFLSKAERRRFDSPPKFNNDERRLHFNIGKDVRLSLGRIEQPVNKVGFLLQFGYFQASARFYPTAAFRPRDVEYVKRILNVGEIELQSYRHIVLQRHRRSIRSILNWRKVDGEAREELVVHANRYVANQEYPKRIFFGLVDLCWKRRWEIPAYHDLNNIITQSFNDTDRDLLVAVRQALEPRQVEKLEILLRPIRHGAAAGSPAPLTPLKRLDQSLRPGNIKRSLSILTLFRDHFFDVATAIDVLPLTDRATEYYATWLTKADHQQLSQFPNRHKAYLHLLAFIKHQFYQRQDHAIDVLLKTVTSARSYAKRQLNSHDQEKQKDRALAVQVLRQAQLTSTELINGLVPIIRADDATPNEKYYKIEKLVMDFLAAEDPDQAERLQALDNDIQTQLKNTDYYDLLMAQSAKLQRRVASVVRTVTFDAETSDADLIAAIDHFKGTDGRIGARPPSGFLTKQERNAVYLDDGIVTPLYKSLLFFHTGDGIKSGKLNLEYSYRFRAIQDYLIPRCEWENNKERLLKECGLSEYADGSLLLDRLKHDLDERYRTVNSNILEGKNPCVSIGDDERARVRTPKTDYDSHSFISTTLNCKGIIPVLDLLRSVNSVCHFTKAFRHYATKHAKMKPANEVLMAGILAQGCNIGLGKLAHISTDLEIDALRNTVNWYFAPENIRAANDRITSIIAELALANNYLHNPSSIHSSSDGRKMNVAVDCLHASYSYKYHGKEKGVTDYTFIDERQALTHSLVFSSSDREAPYVIDGLVDNPVAHGLIHSTDTHGFTEQIFGATYLMGISFAPRLANLHRSVLYGFSTRRTYKKLGFPLVPSRTINRKLILRHWDDILRFIATIRSHHATASQLFKRLSSYAKDHPLYQALKEFGRVVKSQFILTYYDDVILRQRIQKQLNLVEQANKFSSAVFFDNEQAFQDGSLQQQESAISCKLLLQNAIILWNYLSLSERIIETSDADERQQIIDSIRRGSVITWSHVNLRGEYSFAPPAANDPAFDFEKIKALQIN